MPRRRTSRTRPRTNTTRGLEAANLARGQSRHAKEVEAAIAAFEKLELRLFQKDEAINLGAVVELENKDERTIYFIGLKPVARRWPTMG